MVLSAETGGKAGKGTGRACVRMRACVGRRLTILEREFQVTLCLKLKLMRFYFIGEKIPGKQE